MLPLASTLAQLVATGKPVAVGRAVPELINAQAPRIPFTLVEVVLMVPEPPLIAGGTKTTAPLGLGESKGANAPSLRFAVPPEPLLARMMAGPRPIVVPLKVWVLLTLAFPVKSNEAKLVWFKPCGAPPRVNAELGEMILLAGEAACVKS